MVSENIMVKNKSGLHLRPATELNKVAMNCASNVTLISGTKKVNPKSVIMLMGCGIKCGTEITVQCDGATEVEDLASMIEAIRGGFGEEMIP